MPQSVIAVQLWPFWCGRIKAKNGQWKYDLQTTVRAVSVTLWLCGGCAQSMSLLWVRQIDALADEQRDELQSFIAGLEERVLSDHSQEREYWTITQIKYSPKRGGHLCENLFFIMNWNLKWIGHNLQEIELDFQSEWERNRNLLNSN